MIAILFEIPQIDKQYRRLTAKNNGVPMPEFRLPVANVGAVCIPISLLWYGWAVQAHTFYLVPIIGPFLWHRDDLHLQYNSKLLYRGTE